MQKLGKADDAGRRDGQQDAIARLKGFRLMNMQII